jgi:glycosyltransferase involved in cell wall biosynthesis
MYLNNVLGKIFAKIEKNFKKKKVLEKKLSREKLQYKETPRVSAIVQFFNKKSNIKALYSSLKKSGFDEIIVIDDGSSDNSFYDWVGLLDRPNDFLIRANDIYEIRTYSRAIDFARGEFIVLLQDDDIPPASPIWVDQAIQLFEKFPKLIVLGGREALQLMMPDEKKPGEPATYKVEGDVAGCPEINKYKIFKKPIFNTKVGDTDVEFMFAEYVNRAPVFLRKAEVLSIGGINQEFAPFQLDDADLCLRAWLAGYEVGFWNCDFKRDVGTGGMRLFNQGSMGPQAEKNWRLLYSTFGDKIAKGEFAALTEKANQRLQIDGL